MAFGRERQIYAGSAASQAVFDEGLRAYMLRVYNYMASGLALTGIVAALIAQASIAEGPGGQLLMTEFGQMLFTGMMRWVVMLAPLAFILVLSFGLHKMSFFTAQAVFWVFAGAMGISLATIFMIYTGTSIARVFFITAGTFAAMSLYGYTTKRDLTRFGSFLMMGLIGVIIASVVNMFLNSSALHFAISVIGVLVFVGLTAYDTQKIKNEYSEHHDHETSGKLALMGALHLYLDFINLFVLLLQLFGSRR
ncbi:MAG: FtsH-binding integral membrane protein [Alphaproteobacteria bacterium]|jgi:FtsH-binding integral membrane protein